MKLYDFELSGNCYKVRLMLSLLGLPYEQQQVDLAAGEQKSESFLALNPKGEVPVLQDEDMNLSDSNAILVYLATKYDLGNFLPQEPAVQAKIQFWLSTAANEIHHGVAKARVIKLFGYPFDYEQAVDNGVNFLNILEQHLGQHDWLTTDHITIADITIYPYVALAEDGEISLEPYKNIHQWFERVEALSGYIPLPQVTSMA